MNYINKRLNLTAEPANSLTLHYKVMIGGSFNLIHKSLIEGSADWVQQPDWVITAFKHSVGIFKLNKRGNYSNDPDMPGSPLDFFTSVESEIFSVRRSDGVEFKVGDDCGKSHMGYDKIIKFEIADDIMIAHFEHMPRIELSELQHTPTVIFTTHDGVDITDGETVYLVCSLDGSWNASPIRASIESKRPSYFKYFSTKVAADNYIAENKPLYSLADIRKAWETLDLWHDWSDFANELKQVK